MQSISKEMLGWMKLKLESRFLGEISITSDIYLIYIYIYIYIYLKDISDIYI